LPHEVLGFRVDGASLAQTCPDLVSVLAEIGPKMREKGKPIGYLINTLKGKISDAMSKKK
jgi:hypothetical protein